MRNAIGQGRVSKQEFKQIEQNLIQHKTRMEQLIKGGMEVKTASKQAFNEITA